VALRVSDTGSGIAPDVLPKVFDPFFTTKQADKGSGLGLSQVYGFSHQSGGTVAIDSELGKGTTVTIYLPRADEAASGSETEAGIASGWIGSGFGGIHRRGAPGAHVSRRRGAPSARSSRRGQSVH
jgi:hypothetical protein